ASEFASRIKSDTAGVFARACPTPKVPPAWRPYLAQTPAHRRPTGIRQQYQKCGRTDLEPVKRPDRVAASRLFLSHHLPPHDESGRFLRMYSVSGTLLTPSGMLLNSDLGSSTTAGTGLLPGLRPNSPSGRHGPRRTPPGRRATGLLTFIRD